MHPSRYPTDSSRVGLVGTLLSGTGLAWFASLLEKESPLLNNFEDFIEIDSVLLSESFHDYLGFVLGSRGIGDLLETVDPPAQ